MKKTMTLNWTLTRGDAEIQEYPELDEKLNDGYKLIDTKVNTINKTDGGSYLKIVFILQKTEKTEKRTVKNKN